MRTEKLQAKMKQRGIEALLISEASMIDYLIGKRFNVAERFIGLVVTQNELVLYLNRLFPYENTELTIHRFDDTDNIIHTVARSLTCTKLGVDHHLASPIADSNHQRSGQLRFRAGRHFRRVHAYPHHHERRFVRQSGH